METPQRGVEGRGISDDARVRSPSGQEHVNSAPKRSCREALRGNDELGSELRGSHHRDTHVEMSAIGEL